MKREWKPGDVAMVSWTYDGRGETEPAVRRSKGWDALDDATGFLADIDVYKVRPLVVIDPEDREQVERLLSTYHDWKWARERSEASINDMQAALREFANPKPPKPDEPTGLGAVVEAINDNFFVRIDMGRKAWRRQGDIDPAWTCEWSDIAAVRVLSEGVQP